MGLRGYCPISANLFLNSSLQRCFSLESHIQTFVVEPYLVEISV